LLVMSLELTPILFTLGSQEQGAGRGLKLADDYKAFFFVSILWCCK
jgi:hypothetical protein